MVPQRDTGGSKVVTILDFFFGALTALVWFMQVTAALMITARCLNTPGGNFGSIWPNIQVNMLWS